MPLFPLRPAATLWPPVLLGSQFVFNIGFYAVVPFLALFLRDEMLLSGGLIGLILGLRTFSQQGMFIIGGTLADRYGAKAIILAGCVVRVAGYLLLACGTTLEPIILAGADYPRRLPDGRRRGAVLPVDRGPAGADRYPQPGQRKTQPRRVVCAVCGVR